MIAIRSELSKRILILDGAIGTMLQCIKFGEEVFRSDKFADHPVTLKDNIDILNITKPDAVANIHVEYIRAGADIIKTNTFNSNKLSQIGYCCESFVREMNIAGVRIAKTVASECRSRHVYVAGSIGPTAISLTLERNFVQPDAKIIDFDTMTDAYIEQIEALVDASADLLLVETAFDTLNVKAALSAINSVQQAKITNIPVMLSLTINDCSGQLLSRQTLEEAYNDLCHYPLLSFGLNCSPFTSELERHIEMLASKFPSYISIYPNAGLPDNKNEYDETPQSLAANILKIARKKLINIAGGCCGTTPAHIEAIACALKSCQPRKIFQPPDDSALWIKKK